MSDLMSDDAMSDDKLRLVEESDGYIERLEMEVIDRLEEWWEDIGKAWMEGIEKERSYDEMLVIAADGKTVRWIKRRDMRKTS